MRSLLWALSGTLVLLAGCAQHVTRPLPPSADNSYVDLVAGMHIRIVTPILRDGATLPLFSAKEERGSSITLTAINVIGYSKSEYVTQGKPNGPIRLILESAESTRDGKTEARKTPDIIPFAMPRRASFIRLVYLIRNSQADHNMAIIASSHPDALIEFTNRLRRNPGICEHQDDRVSCAWIPAGVAVRPES